MYSPTMSRTFSPQLRISRELEGFQSPRLQFVVFPDPGDGGVVQAYFAFHQS
jgi:hypothetical protein